MTDDHPRALAMLTPTQLDQYRELGYLVVPDVLGRELLADVKRRVDAIVAEAAQVTAHTDVYDLEDSHSAQEPRVRRIKTPHKHFPFFAELTRSPRITGILAQLLGQNIRLHGSKLNMKSAGLRRAGRMASGLGVLPAHQRRRARDRHLSRRLRHGERPDVRRRQHPQGA